MVEYSKKYNIKLVCTNDVHFVDEENAEAHDRLICLSTGKDLDDPNRMLYTKQEWMKTREEMNEVFADVPEALANTCDICDQVEFIRSIMRLSCLLLPFPKISEQKRNIVRNSPKKICSMNLPKMKMAMWSWMKRRKGQD